MTVKGIDVSGYQGETYATSGMDFVFVKSTEGRTYVNSKQTPQARHGREAGLILGFYHFLHPKNIQAQAEHFVTECASQAGDILACDWESTNTGSASCEEKDAFIKAVKLLRPSHRVILYCPTSYWKTRDTTSYCGDGLWIAEYGVGAGRPHIQADWLFHQYTSKPIDTSVGQFEDKAALKAWATKQLAPA
ncbi:GH25 family lysozyme [Streptomyces sp. NPDC005476]|uniref:glycoside hydrolase family 25 protein n=1 Tax=Streptomyces sp. NPDC005476 TaxID=3156882 RepID=UPI00345453BC